jgi:T-complex protein 1 subunit theta
MYVLCVHQPHTLPMAQFGEAQPGLDQYAINKFGISLEVKGADTATQSRLWQQLITPSLSWQVVPRTLAQNAGMDAAEVIAEMYAAHKAGNGSVGIDVENCVTADRGVLDLLHTKREAIKMATDVRLPKLQPPALIASHLRRTDK